MRGSRYETCGLAGRNCLGPLFAIPRLASAGGMWETPVKDSLIFSHRSRMVEKIIRNNALRLISG